MRTVMRPSRRKYALQCFRPALQESTLKNHEMQHGMSDENE